MRISFDHTIATALSAEQLWKLLVQSFRNSDESPIWPHALESLRSAQIEDGALVRAVYKAPGGMQSKVTYRFAEVEPARSSYGCAKYHSKRSTKWSCSSEGSPSSAAKFHC